MGRLDYVNDSKFNLCLFSEISNPDRTFSSLEEMANNDFTKMSEKLEKQYVKKHIYLKRK